MGAPPARREQQRARDDAAEDGDRGSPGDGPGQGETDQTAPGDRASKPPEEGPGEHGGERDEGTPTTKETQATPASGTSSWSLIIGRPAANPATSMATTCQYPRENPRYPLTASGLRDTAISTASCAGLSPRFQSF